MIVNRTRWLIRTASGVAFVAAFVLLALAAPTSGAEPEGAPLAWSNVTAVLASYPSTGPERDLDVSELIGKTVALPLSFVRSEQDAQAATRHVYRHAEGKCLFTCFMKSPAAIQASGTLTGRVTRVRFLQKDLRGMVSYALWLDLATPAPAPRQQQTR